MNQLDVLIQMQNYDDQIADKEIVKKQLPQDLHDLNENLEKATEAVELSKKNLENNLKTQKSNEILIETNKEQIIKYLKQMETIKDNKPYKALNNEITHLKKKNAEIDDEILALMENETKLKDIKDDAKKQFNEAKKALKNNEDKLKKKIGLVEIEINDLKQKRNNLGKTLPRNIVNRYALLIKNKNRKAVVFLDEHSACSGCGFKLRPQMEIEVKEKIKLLSCENCGRIITFKE